MTAASIAALRPANESSRSALSDQGAVSQKPRYRLLHVAARITRTVRRARLRIAEGRPWAGDLVDAFTRLTAPPRPIT